MITTMKELRKAWRNSVLGRSRECRCGGKVWHPAKNDPKIINCRGLKFVSLREFVRDMARYDATRGRGAQHDLGVIFRYEGKRFPEHDLISEALAERLMRKVCQNAERQGRFSAPHVARFMAKQALSLEYAAESIMRQLPIYRVQRQAGEEKFIFFPGGPRYRALVDYIGRLEQIGARKALQKEIRRVEDQVESTFDELLESVAPEVVRLKNEANGLARGLYRSRERRAEIARKVRNLRNHRLKYGPLAPQTKMTPKQVEAIISNTFWGEDSTAGRTHGQ